MKRTFFAFLAIVLTSGGVSAQQFYNTLPSNLDFAENLETSVLELNNAYYKVETEANDAMNFHSNIRLIKTDTNGAVIWVKRYDAGVDSSLTAIGISKTNDNEIVISGGVTFDNSTQPPIGVSLFKTDTSGVVLWSALCDKYTPDFYVNSIIQMNDSVFVFASSDSSYLDPCLIRLNSNTLTARATVFQNTVLADAIIHSLYFSNNTFSLCFSRGEFITIDTGMNILSDKNYNADLSGPYLSHTILSNGDHVFVDDEVAGGFGLGVFRIFRTDSIGNEIWAKNVTSLFNASAHTFSNQYDVIECTTVMENTSGDIIVGLLDENSDGLMVVFDGNGNVLFNKVLPTRVLKLCSDGAVLAAQNTLNSKSFFSKQLLESVYECDSSLDVTAVNGNDSASSVVTGTTAVAKPVTVSALNIHVTNSTVTPVVFCSVTGIVPVSKPNSSMLIYPDPASTILTVALPSNIKEARFEIFDIAGALVKDISLSNVPFKVDVADLPPGVYILQSFAAGSSSRQKFVKE